MMEKQTHIIDLNRLQKDFAARWKEQGMDDCDIQPNTLIVTFQPPVKGLNRDAVEMQCTSDGKVQEVFNFRHATKNIELTDIELKCLNCLLDLIAQQENELGTFSDKSVALYELLTLELTKQGKRTELVSTTNGPRLKVYWSDRIVDLINLHQGVIDLSPAVFDPDDQINIALLHHVMKMLSAWRTAFLAED